MTEKRQADTEEPEGLADFVRRTRAERGFSLTDVERKAKQAGYEIAGSYVNRIENEIADADGLTVKKLQALAAGLEVSEDVIFAIARGLSPAAPDVEHARILRMYDDIPRQCQRDVVDLLEVLQRNHSLSARKRRQSGRKAAAAAAAATPAKRHPAVTDTPPDVLLPTTTPEDLGVEDEETESRGRAEDTDGQNNGTNGRAD